MDDSDFLNLYSEGVLNSVHSHLSPSRNNNLSELERDINPNPRETNNIESIRDELMQSLLVDQREQINFLKDEILFLREESRQKSKYIELLYRSNKKDSTPEENQNTENENEINNETDLSLLVNSLKY